MLGAITMLIGAFECLEGKASGFPANEADIEVCVVVVFVASAGELALVEEVGDFLDL